MKKILVIVAGIVGLIFVIIGAALKINNNAISVIGGVDCILRHTAAVGAVVQRPLCGLSSGRN